MMVFDRLININLRGAWNCMKGELRQMVDQGSGAIHMSRAKPGDRTACNPASPCLRAVSFAPSRSVFHNPINQGTFKADVVASFLAFNPFVTKDLLAFS
jgi:hypothetical protein